MDGGRTRDRHDGDYFLHAEPSGAAAARTDLAKMTHERRVAGKRMSFEIKSELEASRPVGMAPTG